jgi:serine/threonine-protein kinase
MVLKIFNKDKLFSPLDKIGEYTIVRKIGEGRYGICYLIEDGQKKYLLKQLKRRILKRIGVKAGFEEEILMKLQCASIPRFIERFEDKDFYGYILEYKDGKIFEDIIYSEKYAFARAEIFRVGAQLIDIIK